MLIDDADELESAIYEAEEFHDNVVDKIATAARFLELSAAKPSQRSQMPPPHQQKSVNHCWEVHNLTQM